MRYDEIINRIAALDFIRDRDMAEAGCKAVWGIIASSIDESVAAEITQQLPGDLTREKLRGHQVREISISSENFIAEIGRQFNLQPEQARKLIETGLNAGMEALREDTVRKLLDEIPEDVELLF